MSNRRKAGRALCTGAVIAGLVIGCVPYDSGGEAGGGGTGATGTTTLAGTDAQVCGEAAQILVGCGAVLDTNAFKADCTSTANAGLVACFRQGTATCNPLASCVLAAACSGAAPSGTGSCEAGQECVASCGGNGNSSCICGCAAQVGSLMAIDIYALVTCTVARCGIECGESGDPASCESCHANECTAVADQCN